jgi:hypothetical protein
MGVHAITKRRSPRFGAATVQTYAPLALYPGPAAIVNVKRLTAQDQC